MKLEKTIPGSPALRPSSAAPCPRAGIDNLIYRSINQNVRIIFVLVLLLHEAKMLFLHSQIYLGSLSKPTSSTKHDMEMALVIQTLLEARMD